MKNLEDKFDFSTLDKNHELYSTKNKKVVGKFKIETPKNVFIDDIVCLRSKMYAFRCKDDTKDKNRPKGISKSQSKNIKFQEYYNCLFGKEFIRSCEIYSLRQINHDMKMQKVNKTTLSIFGDKRNHLNNILSLPWN